MSLLDVACLEQSGKSMKSIGVKVCRLLLSVSVALMWCHAQAEQRERFQLGCISSPDMPDTQYLASIITPILERGGYQLEIESGDATLINQRVQQGELKGDCGRWRAYGDAYPNMLRVDPPFRHETFGVWGAADKVHEPVANLRLGQPSGWFVGSPILSNLGYGSLKSYPGFDDLLDAVVAGELDAFVSYGAGISQRQDDLIKAGIRHHQDIVSVPIHLFLRPEWQTLVPYFSVAIESRQNQNPFPKLDLKQLNRAGERHIVFSCSIPAQYPLFEVVEDFYRQAFEALGYRFTMVPMPRIREMAEVINGRVDGSCVRTNLPPFNDKEHLILVDVPLAGVSTIILSTRQLDGEPEQILTSGRLGYVRGSQVSINALKHFPGMEVVGLNTQESGLKMLVAGRIDYLLDNSVVVKIVSETLGIESLLYRKSFGDPVLLYPYLNRRYEELAEPLAEQLRHQLQQYPGNLIVGWQ
ncbi:MAG: hypothetical protein AseanaTS_01980 [Candidatus Pelagadaptatus aseana]|uniref:hypothetical protein n=1 Tax=Candidatus Pelagadaptatus aseana TaxID=3120508 RepID=UPI0039B1E653